MISHRMWLVGLIFLLMCAGATLPAVAVAGDTVNNGTDSVEISEQVLSTTGEQTVVVQLSDRSPSAIQSTAASDQPATLRAHATETQDDIITFTENNPHVELDSQLWIVNAVVLTIDTDVVSLERIADIDHVEKIHEDYEVHTVSTAAVGEGSAATELSHDSPQPATIGSPDSTSGQTTTRAIDAIGVPDVWDTYDTRGEGVRVAVIDTGVNPNHPDIDIAGENWVCYIDCTGNPDGPHDVDGHGTHVSGTIVGGDANDVGLQIGVAPESTLLHAKGMGDSGSGTFESIALSMQWAINNDADILTMSLGTSGTNDAFIELVRNAHHSGVPVIAAVGNEEAGTSGSPANVYEAIAVGSVNIEPAFPEGVNFGLEDNVVSEFSGGETITSDDWVNPPEEWPDSYIVPDMTAPGAVIWSADTDLNTETCSSISTNDLTCKGGTSMATPHVAGIVALMQSATDDHLTPNEIATALTEAAWKPSGESVTKDERYGNGIVDAYAATESVTKNAEPANLTITSASANKNTIFTGESVTITATINNTGELAGTFTGELRINGTVSNTTSIEIEAETAETISFKSTFHESGTYLLEINDYYVTDVSVKSKPKIVVSNLQPQTLTVTQGDTINISAVVSNTGTGTVTTPIELRVNNKSMATTNRTLTSNESETILFSEIATTPFSPGEYNYSIWTPYDESVGQLVVETGQHPSGVSQQLFAAVDQDGSSKLSRGEIRTMVRSYVQDGSIQGVTISRKDVRDLIRFYIQQ